MEIVLLVASLVSLVAALFSTREQRQATKELEVSSYKLKLETAQLVDTLQRVQTVSSTYNNSLAKLEEISKGQEQVLENFVENLLVRDAATIKFMSDVKEFTGDVAELNNFVEYVAKMDSFNGIPVIAELKQSIQQLVKNAGELGKNIEKSLESKDD